MVNVPMRPQGPMNRHSIGSMAPGRARPPLNAHSVLGLNMMMHRPPEPPRPPHPVPPPPPRPPRPVPPPPPPHEPHHPHHGPGLFETAAVAVTAAAVGGAVAAAASSSYSSSQTAASSNNASDAYSTVTAPIRSSANRAIPQLLNPTQKGQKSSLESGGKLSQIRAGLGWNVSNSACDVDVSAFMLDAAGKVPGDDWFVFYGQTTSPDGSTVYHDDGGADRQMISIDLTRLNPSVTRIVFVLTINEALNKGYNFSMISDAYIRIMDGSGNELVSFRMNEYYDNVISMMIGEIYLHNGSWKFNAIGNGVAKDLAGLCGLYGVNVE